MSIKPSPNKRQKVGDENEENVDVEEGAQGSLPEKTIQDGDGLDSDEGLIRRKTPIISAADIFHIAPLGPDHRPGNGDFVPGPFEKEPSEIIIERRRKQVDYGKNTTDYMKYAETIPKLERLASHPHTPNIYRKYSRRGWDGLIRLWRFKLHLWEMSPEEAEKLIQEKFRSESAEVMSEIAAGESSSTSSSAMEERDPEAEVSFLSEGDEVEETPVEEPKVKAVLEERLRTSSAVVVEVDEGKKEPSSWYQDTLDFEEEYLNLHPDPDEDLDLNL